MLFFPKTEFIYLGWYLYLSMKIEESDEVKFNTTTLKILFIIPMSSFNNTVTHL
jgi:hypothetical protein